MAPTEQRTEQRIVPKILTLQEAADYLKIGIWGMRRLVWEGQLPVVRIRRKMMFDKGDLDRFIEQQKVVH